MMEVALIWLLFHCMFLEDDDDDDDDDDDAPYPQSRRNLTGCSFLT